MGEFKVSRRDRGDGPETEREKDHLKERIQEKKMSQEPWVGCGRGGLRSIWRFLVTPMDLLQWNERGRIQSKDCDVRKSVAGEETTGSNNSFKLSGC